MKNTVQRYGFYWNKQTSCTKTHVL